MDCNSYNNIIDHLILNNIIGPDLKIINFEKLKDENKKLINILDSNYKIKVDSLFSNKNNYLIVKNKDIFFKIDEILKNNNNFNILENEFYKKTDEEIEIESAIKNKIIDNNLSISQNFHIINYLSKQILKEFEYLNINDNELNSSIKEKVKLEFFDYLNKKLKEINDVLDENTSDDFLKIINEKKLLLDSIKNNYSQFEEESVILLDKLLKIKEEDLIEEKNYSKSGLEENFKNKVSQKMKRLWNLITEIDKNGNEITGFLGLPNYVGFDHVDKTLRFILNKKFGIESNFEKVIEKLNDNIIRYRWLPQVIDILKNGDKGEVKNSFLVNYIKEPLNMKYIMQDIVNNNVDKYTIFSSNYQTQTNRIINKWKENLKVSNLITRTKKGDLKINLDKVNEYIKDYSKFYKKDQKEIDNNDIINWLNNFGIEIHNDYIEDLKSKFNSLYSTINNNGGLIFLLNKYLLKIKDEKEVFLENNHPYSDANKSIKNFARNQSKYENDVVLDSYRDTGKTYSYFVSPDFISDRYKELTENDNKIRFELKSKSYNGKSFILKKLINDENFRNIFSKFDLSESSLRFKNIIKNEYFPNIVNYYNTDENNSISKKNFELVKLSFFTNLKEDVINNINEDIELRTSNLLFPTISDKDRSIFFKTASLNLTGKYIDKDLRIDTKIIEFIYSQVVEPDLDRIINFKRNIKNTNTIGYDFSANMFLSMPILNELRLNKKIPALAYFDYDPIKFDKKWFEDKFKQTILNLIEESIYKESVTKLKNWEEFNIINKDKNNFYKNILIDKEYLQSRSNINNSNHNIKIASLDYTINYIIHLANMYMLFSGDLALYSPKSLKNFFHDKSYKIKENLKYNDIITKNLGSNLGKRLANQISSGRKLANSENNKYVQLFIDDHVTYSESLGQIAKIFYSENDGNEVDYVVKRLKNLSNYEKKIELDKLSTKFPKISPFINIETTDAQGYITSKEALYILFNDGKLSENEYNDLTDKLEKNNVLTKEELQKIFQPLKPVFTGQINQDNNDQFKSVYIKYSAFPLLPQLTKGFEIDKLRKLMEEIEIKEKMNVSASYSSGNKIGSPTPLQIINEDGKFIESFNDDDYKNSSLVLPRKGFKIQQDLPYKSNQKKIDKISNVTQAFKILFSDGIKDIDDFIYKNNKISGEKLYDEFFNNFNYLENQLKDEYLEELGFNNYGEFSENANDTSEKFKKFIKDNIINERLSKEQIKNLEIVKIKDSQDNVIDFDFVIPLWLSPHSNVFETLMISNTSNKLINFKLPGNSFVVGSDTGFKLKEIISIEEINSNNIVFTDSFDKELKFNQILVPPKFKDQNGELIEFIHDNGEVNKIYVYIDENGRKKLREDMIEKELLKIPSFRIPISGLMSTNESEIVGFLPKESGDIMIKSKELIPQKGLDHDFDKEYVYQLNTFVYKEGKIKVFDKKNPNSNELKKNIENNIIRVFKSILSNEKVKKRIVNVINTDELEAQANKIEEISSQDFGNFPLLSTNYQDHKYFTASAGKAGVGMYSLALSLHHLINENNADIDIIFKNNNLQIGNIQSNGSLGNQKAIDKMKNSRNYSDIYSERQNSALDNETKQILSKININKDTLPFDILLTALGFDKDIGIDGKEIMVVPYILSQPIIKEYLEKLNNQLSSIENLFVSRKEIEEKVFSSFTGLTDPIIDNSHILTGKNLESDLIEPTRDIQLAVLNLFVFLNPYAKEYMKLASGINITGSKLGQSYLEVIEKLDFIENNTFQYIRNHSELIGKYVDLKDVSDPEIDYLESQGYIKLRTKMIKPTTVNGTIAVNSIQTAYNIWNKFFPFDNYKFKDIFDKIKDQHKNSELFLKDKKNIINNFKKYIYSIPNIGFYETSAQDKRRELFYDSNNNTSLANYLNKNKELPALKKYRLLSKFEYSFERGNRSLIKYNNTSFEDFDQENLELSLLNMLYDNLKLPNKNGKEYSTRFLAKDLASYAYLSGVNQEAIDFIRYINVDYLNKIIPFAEVMREDLSKDFYKKIDTNNFLYQYFQNNPNDAQYLNKVDYLKMKKTYKNSELIEFNYSSKNDRKKPDKIGRLIDDDKKINKNSLYFLNEQVDNKNNQYFKLDQVKNFGISQYDTDNKIIKNIFSDKNFHYEDIIKNNSTSVKIKNNSKSDIDNENIEKRVDLVYNDDFSIQKTLSNISHLNLKESSLSKLALLYNYLNLGNLKIVNYDFVDNSMNFFYHSKEEKISINNKFLNNSNLSNDLLSQKILHFTTHHLIGQFIHKNEQKSENQDSLYLELNILFNRAKKAIGLDKINSVVDKINNKKSFNKEEQLLYGFKDLSNFVAAIMSNPEFQDLLNIKYEKNKSIIKKFKELLSKIVEKILGERISKDTFTFSTIEKAIEIILNNQDFTGLNSENFTEFNTIDLLNQIDNLLNFKLSFSDKFSKEKSDPFTC